ncbi:hypothetical protein Goari_021544 [Gossypium aridum]|uniref:Receptor ligand binding region domain-containing protein n=1 Tax=Gossypium aridum TaxID=34290 RepID=A0A7J8YG74_GOSAI|nr:hypothetical protein [Gossypium aridum]
MMKSIAETKKVVHVGVILDVNSPVGSVANACIPMAISDFYAAHRNFRTRLSLHHRNSDDALAAAFTALELIDNEEDDAIIGPQKTMQARFVIDVGQKAQVPVFSSQAKGIAAIVQTYEWHEVILMYEDTEYGSDLIPYLADEFQQFDIRTRVIVVHMSSSIGSKLFLLAKETILISEGYAWIITDGLSTLLDPMGAKVIGSMQGVLGKAVEMVPQESSSANGENHHRNTSQFPVIKVSKIGKMILNGLLKTKFKGLSGDFSLVRGQLRSSAFEIINVINNKEKVIGYWTLENGLRNTKDIPRGWTTPVGGNKLRIGVPDKPGFEAYLKVEQDPYTKEFTVTGFSYDVFEEGLALLPFAVPHKLIPFPIDPNAGTYNKLLYHVKNQVLG